MRVDLMRLKGERVTKGLTQAELAKKIGLSRIAYANRENGKISLDANELAQIAEVLGYGKDELGIFFKSSFKK